MVLTRQSKGLKFILPSPNLIINYYFYELMKIMIAIISKNKTKKGYVCVSGDWEAYLILPLTLFPSDFPNEKKPEP